MTDRFDDRRRVRRFFPAFAILVLVGCNGETLYDTEVPTGPGPAISIERPVAGADVLPGRTVPVRIVASDSLGVSLIELTWSGVAAGVIRFSYVPPRLSVVADTFITLNSTATGRLELRAAARNGPGATSRSEPVIINVTPGDTIIPNVAVAVQLPQRLELTDTIRVRVTARDNEGGSGLVRIGFTALVTTSAGPDTLVFERVAAYAQPLTGTRTEEFAFTPPFVDERSLPRTLRFSIHGFAVDSASNCGAAVRATEQRLPCASYVDRTGEHIVAAGIPDIVTSVVAAGRSVQLPAGSNIADAVPDPFRERLWLSNLGRSRLEALDLRTRIFMAPVIVGSQPWGIGLNRTGDTLIVANSGGTNLSFVSLQGTPVENVPARVRTPNAVLFTVERQFDLLGRERLQVRFFDFSDRPQFVAQDAAGRLLYSTVPTNAAPNGTIRVAENAPGWEQPEVKFLIRKDIFEADSTNTSILNVDSMRVFSSIGGGDFIEIYDHRRGFPSTVIRSGIVSLDSAIQVLVNNPDSDIEWVPGRYDMDLFGLRDTTFVAASANRQRVAFGEGSKSAGRIFMWNATTASISNEITVRDLVGNSSEHIFGLDLNLDGSLGAARGQQAAYFFMNDLRLQGHFAAPVTTGGSGAVVHPQHPSYTSFPPSGANTLAFVAEGTRVRIVDTVHFVDRGTIEVRDPIRGPLRVSAPLPSDNAAGCAGADCIIAKLYGVTSAGSIVIVDVRSRDIK